MRILVIGPSLLMPWAGWVASALTRLGHEVQMGYSTNLLLDRFTLRRVRSIASDLPGLTGFLDAARSRWQKNRDHRLIKLAQRFHPNLILDLWGYALSAPLLTALKEIARCPLFTWWMDDPFRKEIQALLPVYDLFFVFDRSYMAALRQQGAHRVEFLPCACDETMYRPPQLTQSDRKRYACDVALVAWFYPKRAEVVKGLADFNLKVWGRQWRSPQARGLLNGAQKNVVASRYLSPQTAAKVYAASKIALNVHSDQSHDAGLNLRTFEILASGGFELVDAVPGMEELLIPGKEAAVYHSPGEAREMAAYYLRHPEERADIAQRGRDRVLREHTYLHRMQGLLQKVGR